MIRKKIFRRTANLISQLILSILILLVVYSLIEQRRQVRDYALSFGIVIAGEVERLVQWDDRYALRQSIDRLLESDPFFRYILVIRDGEIYSESSRDGIHVSEEFSMQLSEYPAHPYYRNLRDEDGVFLYEIIVPVIDTDSFMRIGIERKAIDNNLIPYICVMLAVGLIILAAGIIFARKIAEKSTAEINLLSKAIRNYQDSYDSSTFSESVREITTEELAESFSRLVAERRTADDMLKKSLAEKDALLKEIYHRTGNNMQIISSLLYLQCDKYSDPDFLMMVEKLDCRIHVMAIAHQLMYDSNDLSSISIKKYIADLSSFIIYKYSKYSKNVSLNLETEDFKMLYDKAVPIGLILNELISNSLLHAFPSDGRGEIKIETFRYSRNSNRIIINYSDNGYGLPEDFDLRNSCNSLGIKIITALAEEQLDGVLSLHSRDGCFCSFEFDT